MASSFGLSDSDAAGWLTSIAWVATLATGSIFAGTIIQGLIILNYPNYVAQPWHGTLISIGIVVVAVCINTLLPRLLPKLEIFVLVFHLIGESVSSSDSLQTT